MILFSQFIYNVIFKFSSRHWIALHPLEQNRIFLRWGWGGGGAKKTLTHAFFILVFLKQGIDKHEIFGTHTNLAKLFAEIFFVCTPQTLKYYVSICQCIEEGGS